MISIKANKECRYCGNAYQKDTEHVFPYGLGGEDMRMNCVCENCNNKFSGLERELYQKSPLAFIRSIEGITGYEPLKSRLSPFKAPLLLIFDEVEKIAYEVGQYQGLKLSLRPQIMSIGEGLYIEGDSEDDLKELKEKFNQWKTQSLKMAFSFSKESRNSIKYVEFAKDSNYSFSRVIEGKFKIGRADIIVSFLSKTHKLYAFLSPRIYIDDEKQLRVRARTLDEAIMFIQNLLVLTTGPLILKSFKEGLPGDSVIYVGQSFDHVKLDRAVLKIALNCLMYYFPITQHTPLIDNYIAFINTGKSTIQLSFYPKNAVTDSQPNTHHVFFFQQADGVAINLSLFNGQMAFRFHIPGLKILKVNEYNRLLIDYKNRKNIFQNQIQFFQSFDTKTLL